VLLVVGPDEELIGAVVVGLLPLLFGAPVEEMVVVTGAEVIGGATTGLAVMGATTGLAVMGVGVGLRVGGGVTGLAVVVIGSGNGLMVGGRGCHQMVGLPPLSTSVLRCRLGISWEGAGLPPSILLADAILPADAPESVEHSSRAANDAAVKTNFDLDPATRDRFIS